MFSGREFHDYLDQLCKENGTTFSAFLLSIGKQKSLKGSIKKAQTPNHEVALAASEHFNVPMQKLLGIDMAVRESAESLELNEKERSLISALRNADPNMQDIVWRVLSAILENKQTHTSVFASSNDGISNHGKEIVKGREFHKRIDGEAAAGVPITAVPDGDSFVSVPEKYLDERYFIVRARGKSMEDTIPDGACCVFQRDAFIDDGSIALVQIDGATDQPDDTIKRIYRKGHQVELRSDNPEFDPMIYPADAVQVAGVLIDVLPYGC